MTVLLVNRVAALRRELEELTCLAADARGDGADLAAALYEADAAVLERRIATLEDADGLACGAPMDGQVAA